MHLVKGYASNLIIDEAREKVWRYGWGSASQGIKRNFSWLQKVHGIIPTPKPLAIYQFGPFILTSETFIAGRSLTAQEALGSHLDQIIATIAPLYKQTKLIHGDLTHRNILLTSQGLYFIDGDRSEIDSAEFDHWLLLADAAAHRDGPTSHRAFIRQLLHNKPLASMDQMPLWTRFVARCLAHSVRDCMRRGKSLDWLDELI